MANNVNVTNRGFEYVAQMLSGNISHFSIPTYIGWGTANGSNATSVVLPATGPGSTQGAGQWFDVGPYSESTEARVVASSTAITGNAAASGTVVTQFQGTITAGESVGIAESFLVPTATKPSVFNITSHAVTSAGGALTVNTGGALANQYYQMNNEVIQISSTAASFVWNINRAQNGSTANAGAINDCLTFGNIPGAGNSNPGNGDMFAHAGFVALSLNSGDSVQFTWNVNITS
ncbi:MAG TPA: hypothetical protein VGR89_16345 [Puia sp.]|nr:hypothetical protein [Puia sp.]